ncbi:hypothetical protein GQ457_09G030540 [Hibiscus cannabinus]
MAYFGNRHSVPGGRLECTMQNIADNFLDKYYPSRCYKDVEDKLDTDIVNNEWRRVTSSAKKKRKPADTSLHQILDSSLLDIMQNAYDLLSQCDVYIPEVESNKYVDSGPPFLIFLQPAHISIWELHNVKVLNDGMDWPSPDNVYWKHDVCRLKALKVIPHGNIEFEANDVTIHGNHVFEVPNGLAVQLDPIPLNLMDRGSLFPL